MEYFQNHCCKRKLFTAFLCLWLVFIEINAWAQQPSNINNPVLPGVADAGVIRYNGEYYIGGVFTKGSFYHSRDLVNWEGPVHVFSMDNEWTEGPSAEDSQIHANDIRYINGIFHQFWSVNHWGKDRHVVHIGHAVASDILGPYKEPVKGHWVDNRIDPALFRDEDGQLYLYMVKFTDGNTIWSRSMKDPWTFSGDPVYMFGSLPNTWETMDNRVAEGPWVFKYRGQYYMMYNANHTSTRWGNYMLGVAQADGPLAFNHGNKYPHPVVKSNQADLEDLYVDLLKFSTKNGDSFLFTTDGPSKNWNSIHFDDTFWESGKTGFGSEKIKNSTSRKVRTDWKDPKIWLRKSFTLDKNQTGNLLLRIHHDGHTRVYLNGNTIYEKEGADYITWNLDKAAVSLLKDEENVLAVESEKGKRSNFLDISLFDIKDQVGDDILYSPGQPNIVRGPNGFEWWLVYMANKNRERRGQYINRIHFYDKKLTVDGITGVHTPGSHPLPAQPTFHDLFDMENDAWQNKWEIIDGDWKPEKGELACYSNDPSEVLVQSIPAGNYLLEANIKMSEGGTEAGVLAWWKDKDNWLKIVLNQKGKSWSYIHAIAGESKKASYELAKDFDYHVYHSLKILKNGNYFTIQLDDLPAPGAPVIQLDNISGKGRPGLYSGGSGTTFDGIVYTIGWDESDEHISGWKTEGGNDSNWKVSREGIRPADPKENNAVFKGDFLSNYEISLQITSENGSEGSAGIYPVYLDTDNYIKAAFDHKNQKFRISGKEKGNPIEAMELSLEGEQSYYTDIRYTDFIEKHFTSDSPVFFDGLRLSKTPHFQQETFVENIHQKVNIFYKQKGKWFPLENIRQKPSTHPGFDAITFAPVWAEGLKFVNKEAEDQNFYIHKIWVNQLFQKSHNLRVRRWRDKLTFWINGKDIAHLPHNFPPSRVGLVTEDGIANFNGITVFHVGE